MATTVTYKSESAAKVQATKRSRAEGVAYAPKQAGDGGWIVERVEPPVLQEQPAPEQPAATVATEQNAFGGDPDQQPETATETETTEPPAEENVTVRLHDFHLYMVGKLRAGATGEKWIDLRKAVRFDLQSGEVVLPRAAAEKQKLVTG